MKKPLIDRLFDNIDKSGGPKACHLWTGYFNGGKYGSLYAHGVQRPAHVWVLMLATGEEPNGRLACHTCDNPPCCNAKHLYWGTQKDNVNDREKRGRSNRRVGETHGMAILTEAQVQEIRARHIPRHPQHSASAIAREVGVSSATIHLVIHRKHWAHV